MTASDLIWSKILRDTRHQVADEADMAAQSPPCFGEFVAWGNRIESGVTDSLSALHRVGVPVENALYTTCGEAIPHATSWLTLGPAILEYLPRCRFCEAEYQRSGYTNAA